MASKSEQGYSLLELIIGVGLILLIGSMIGRYLVIHKESTQILEAKSTSRQLLNGHMSRIRRGLETRDSAVPLAVQPTVLTFQVPIATMARTNSTVTIQNKCRPLPTGETISLRTSVYNQRTKACFEKISCPNGIPYIEWSYTAHPTLTLQKEPSDEAFAKEWKKGYGNAGFGVCFGPSATGLILEGVLVNVERQGSNRMVDLATEIVTLPMFKRNAVDIIP